MNRAFPKIRARRLPDGPSVLVCGREAETLILMASKGAAGLRAYDFPAGPPYRLSAYIFDLRRLGFPIRTEREDHRGGWHAVYFLDGDIAFEMVAVRPPSLSNAA